MAEDKKYYWFRLRKDFFEGHKIKMIESMDNGSDYLVFYLKLLCESVSHEGRLRFSEAIPYSEKMLSVITHTNVDIVRMAMQVFQELELVTIEADATIYMREVASLMGCETASAIRQRKHREIAKLTDECDNVTLLSQKCHIEKEYRERDRDKSIEKDTIYTRIRDAYNSTCVKLPKCITLSDKRKKAIKCRLETYGEENVLKAIQMASESDFMAGKNDKNWQADIDWIMNDNNMAKILDGKYANKQNAYSQPKKEDDFFAKLERVSKEMM